MRLDADMLEAGSARPPGKLGKIASKAKSRGIETVLVKSGDGTHYWSQFSSSLVSRLHARGLNVCAWQFIYGSKAAKEARVGAAAVARGADCLVMDVESQYEGRYPQASTYMSTLRSMVGGDYPIGLASFRFQLGVIIRLAGKAEIF